ncbi:hypothetical protein [Methylicorpusculum sp.]|jgi:hypothetical protein|uniref:hypothetical protein n=2 Tax=Methylicorpusculum sp. TaxID=2713644 RepID=UPI00271B2C02|nr:hypothetical protein [Methylicorpusculum sp.]MDO8845383.1 hypothetical protein [Methylicorpusculum sp.]MDP2178841.1 hypothetical protein [Methylicorpusculum sp.]MDP3529089.1 hypothetical protein [Methylicorpusculum sp.]
MSHTLSYKHLVIKFPHETVQEQLADFPHSFWRDQFILLELCGPSNCTTFHPVTGREVYARNWTTRAKGDATEIIEEACRSAAYCEGRNLRFYRERETTPERYIRRVRSALSAPVSVQEANYWGISLHVQLDQKLVKDAPYAIDLLNQHASWHENDANERYWMLYPLTSLKDAAILFKFRFLPLSPWCFIETNGPCFEHEARGLFSSSNSRAA